ncbi:hypothetical protein D9M68_109310 [compost metagenome]
MSRRKSLPLPLTLAQHFEVPDEYLGGFGWLCGYSADAEFLNTAAEYFTHQTQAQRASVGRVSLALMLDPGNAPISLLDAPGVAHLPLRDVEGRPFTLLHAKVALLGFRHRGDPTRWIVRLIVSTGNWTRQTVEESLDLVWRIDVRSEELLIADSDTRLRCADIQAAHSLLRWLASKFDTRLLDAGGREHPSEAATARDRLGEWLSLCENQAGTQAPRFFHNRDQSLLSQLPAKIRDTAESVSRNCLVMGSGYYESSATPGSVPAVLTEIVGALQEERLLTGSPWLDVFVNPEGCQAVAQAVDAMRKKGFRVRPAGCLPDYFGTRQQRSLHAKFLFSANSRKDSDNCSSAWLYLGSGNLTGPGFTSGMNRHAGNLEAGVVFAPQSLLWGELEDSDPARMVSSVLPVQWDKQFDATDGLSAGGDMPDRPALYVAPPVAWLRWRDAEDAGGILEAEQGTAGLDVLDSMGNARAKTAEYFRWPDARPRQVTIQWAVAGEMRTAEVPVVDAFGRIAATALPRLDLTEAGWQLACFPMAPEDEGDNDANDADQGNAGQVRPAGTGGKGVASYPVREMMELVEQIAAKQTLIGEADWASWCSRLEQTLVVAAGSTSAAAFRALGLNPLSPLKAAPFRPDFAESAATAAGQRYEAVLVRLEETWNVGTLAAIGVAQ